VLRRSIQYALASRTLTVLAVLPAAALIVTLFKNNLAEIITSGSVIYLALLAASIAGLRYRDRARQWLDERFFREEYDARKVLLSLVSRVRFETDPADLATLVVQQIDQALHPETIAMLVSGIEDARLVPVARIGSEVPPLPLEGGLVTMLRWSDEPLEIFLDDPRSPARRLPPAEIGWLEQTATALIIPVLGQDRSRPRHRSPPSPGGRHQRSDDARGRHAVGADGGVSAVWSMRRRGRLRVPDGWHADESGVSAARDR
jgi:hypothetical protein